MKRHWPYFIVASFLNALLVTGAFITIKMRGIAAFDLPANASQFPAWYNVSPLQFAGALFVLSFLAILIIIGVSIMVGNILSRVHTFNESLSTEGRQLAVGK